jgi:hypothetical protein
MACLLEPVAGDGITHRQDEKAKDDGQHEQIGHGNFQMIGASTQIVRSA